MQLPNTTSDTIISALLNESNYRKTRRVELTSEVSAAKTATTSSASREGSASTSSATRCSFCNRRGHALENCHTAKKILKQAKSDYNDNRSVNDDSHAKKKSAGRTRASRTKTVPLEGSDSEDDDTSIDVVV